MVDLYSWGVSDKALKARPYDSGFKLISQNNRNMGLYYWLESIDQYFLERNGYPVGEIIVSNDIGLQNDNLLDKDLIVWTIEATSLFTITIGLHGHKKILKIKIMQRGGNKPLIMPRFGNMW